MNLLGTSAIGSLVGLVGIMAWRIREGRTAVTMRKYRFSRGSRLAGVPASHHVATGASRRCDHDAAVERLFWRRGGPRGHPVLCQGLFRFKDVDSADGGALLHPCLWNDPSLAFEDALAVPHVDRPASGAILGRGTPLHSRPGYNLPTPLMLNLGNQALRP